MMEGEHARHPSFGFRWDFIPGEDLAVVSSLESRGFSHWSLRLETFLKYSGPLGTFLEDRLKHSQVRFFSDYLPAVPAREWDSVHSLASVALLNRTAALRLTCRRPLPEVPPPQHILQELCERMPLSTELSLLVHNEMACVALKKFPDLAATVSLGEWNEASARMSACADLIAEIEVDVGHAKFAADESAQTVQDILGQSRVNTVLDVTFVLPSRTSDFARAAERAEQVRERVFQAGWRAK